MTVKLNENEVLALWELETTIGLMTKALGRINDPRFQFTENNKLVTVMHLEAIKTMAESMISEINNKESEITIEVQGFETDIQRRAN
ncbi:MAG: hypothetical protein WHF31_15290 [Candidatus Dehalobacter alkaniphilus]